MTLDQHTKAVVASTTEVVVDMFYGVVAAARRVAELEPSPNYPAQVIAVSHLRMALDALDAQLEAAHAGAPPAPAVQP